MRWFAVQFALLVATALVAGKRRWRRVATSAVVIAAATVPFLATGMKPLPRALLFMFAGFALIKASEISADPHPWPVWLRLWDSAMMFDVRETRRARPIVDWRLFSDCLLYAGLIAFSVFLLLHAHLTSGIIRTLLRGLGGVTLMYAVPDLAAALVRFIHRLIGIVVPPLQDVPILSRSLGEFWGRRWNRPVSNWLSISIFRPVTRRWNGLAGLFAAFSVSAALHGGMFGIALGWKVALLTAAFFLLQYPAVLIERALHIKNWPSMAARAWTIGFLVATSPLLIFPVIASFGL